MRRSGEYEITLGFGHSDPPGKAGKAHLRPGGVHLTRAIAKDAPSCKFNTVTLTEGWGNVEAWVEVDKAEVLVSDVYIKCLAI